jgi:hypothetical protein
VENFNPESVRKVIDDSTFERTFDLRLYDAHRSEMLRDQYIFYARGVRDAIMANKPLGWIVEALTFEVQASLFEPHIIIEFINFFLQESSVPLQFDIYYNIFKNGRKIVSSHAEKLFADTASSRARHFDDGARTLAETVGDRLLGGHSLPVMIEVASGDIIVNNLDNALVAQYLNAYITAHGSTLQFNQYLELVIQTEQVVAKVDEL